jgi:hypothetical protein
MGTEVNASAGLIYARSRMTIPRPAIPRSLGFGLVAGLGLGAVFLFVRAALLGQVDCTGLLAEDCALEHELGSQLARLHVLFGLGLSLVTAGLVLLLRKKPGAA